jgi:hypothetical protein
VAVEAVVGAEAREAAGLRLAWRGFAFVPGCAAGAPSIDRFARIAAAGGVPAAARALRGQYLAVVEDPARAATYAFVDDSGYFHAFRSPGGAGEDFPALAEAAGLGPGDLDPEAVAELVTQGQVAFGRTLFAAIRRIGPDEVVVLPWAGGGTQTEPKPPPPAGPEPAPLPAQLERLLPTLDGLRISADLTGGLDSRLLAVALARLGVPFETATAGRPDGDEVRLARRVAAALGREHHVLVHRPEDLPADLGRLLGDAGCLADPLVYHRDLQLQRARAERGVDLVLNAQGGEGFKDFFWQQDFPRYAGGQADLERLWRIRIAKPHAGLAPLAGAHAEARDALAARYVERLEAYRARTRTGTYDRIFFEVRSRDVNGRGLTVRNRTLPTFAPLLDRDAVALAATLPVRARVFNGYHRRAITALDPAVARLPTTDGGMTASSAPAALPLDAARWAVTRAVRLARKRVPRLRALPAESPLPPLIAQLRASPEPARAVERLRGAGILTADATPETLHDAHLGGVVALGTLVARLGG